MTRLGRFFIGRKQLMRLDIDTRAIFKGLIVLEATTMWDRDGIKYLAEGKQFDDVPEGEMAPFYDCDIHGSGVTWTKRIVNVDC